MVTTLFIDFSDAQEQLTPKSVINLPKFKSIQAFIVNLVTCKNEKDTLENEGTRVVTCFSHYKSIGIFPNAQVQLTHKPFVGYFPISNQSKILWFFSLPARIKKNQSKIKELE